ncbi:hypothetical protein MMC10_005416 [Thelotrema lepadinum]|nr:hypothetical protein [Thelotrema lepadinum]
MASERPSPFITVPHGFHYHYSDEAPKTPERDTTSEHTVGKPPSTKGFRVKRRSRPRINTSISSMTSEIMTGLQDTPLPSIEISDQHMAGSGLYFDLASRNERLLTPFQNRSLTVPRTPSGQLTSFNSIWTTSEPAILGQSIIRPSSAFSSLSDSSDDSLMSSEDGFSYGGSCTSPESDAPDPFTFASPAKIIQQGPEHSMAEVPSRAKKVAPAKPRWTKETDNHIWAIYMTYLNDPTVTPFKTLPGTPPPVGVCHRVAREAKKSWKGGKVVPQLPLITRVKNLRRGGSPDTLTERSGSSTPTSHVFPRFLTWPGSGSATRKRFRELCKRKATIAPHYQRMMQSRSPSPFFTQPQPGLHSTRSGSPFNARDTFATRDVAISLSTSTASSMQPNAPLARLTMQNSDEWFNDPEVPWASPAPIPSDIDNPHGATGDAIGNLGAPFTGSGSHTWGPSNSRPRERPSLLQANTEDASTIPRLRSPVQFASVPRGSFPEDLAPKTPKRPAQTELEDDLSGGGIRSHKNRFEDLIGGNLQSARRRLRARGMSLENRLAPTSLQISTSFENRPSFATAGPSATSQRPNSSPMSLDSDPFVSGPGDESIKRLGSPFPGIGTRPPRARGRHISSHSLSSYNPIELESIDQRLNQASTMGPF